MKQLGLRSLLGELRADAFDLREERFRLHRNPPTLFAVEFKHVESLKLRQLDLGPEFLKTSRERLRNSHQLYV